VLQPYVSLDDQWGVWKTYTDSILQHDPRAFVELRHFVLRRCYGVDCIVDEQDWRAGLDFLEFCWCVSIV
jgi:hypothetical protein